MVDAAEVSNVEDCHGGIWTRQLIVGVHALLLPSPGWLGTYVLLPGAYPPGILPFAIVFLLVPCSDQLNTYLLRSPRLQ